MSVISSSFLWFASRCGTFRGFGLGQIVEHPSLALFPQAITLATNVNGRRVVQQPVQHGGGQDLVLEYIIMPLSLLVLLALHIICLNGLVQLKVIAFQVCNPGKEPFTSWIATIMLLFDWTSRDASCLELGEKAR